ncbi:MAG TPA: hypothetical protein VF588_21435 [Pyrinomonadaceae bacterium]
MLRMIALTLIALASVKSTAACSRAAPFSFDELFAADVIVRVTAVKYVIPPDPNTRTTGKPESTIEFKVEEVLRGEDAPEAVVLHGYLSDRDDFNDVEVTYKFVRPGGRGGSCFANTYKEGGQFLLFLKKEGDTFTPNISALGPTNEQLRGPDDAWLRWVMEHLKSRGRKGGAEPPPLSVVSSMATRLLLLLSAAS